MQIYEDTLEELYLERARYLLSADNLLEEELSKIQPSVTIQEMGFSRKARTVCCGMLVDSDKAPVARTKTGEQFLVCNDNCRRLVENAASDKIEEIAAVNL